ncbi:hypothetical protein FJZ31_19450 [Candidatus Poribacteria bacterium]|nr:hypothetical protein [Candidatus Poribacteria bacterium]
MRTINAQLAPLALVNISGLGVKGIANVWKHNATSGRTLVDFFHLDADTWKTEYHLTSSAVNALGDQKSLEVNARALQQTLADRGITWLIRDDTDFPLLFMYGNNALLEQPTAALLNSRTSDVVVLGLGNATTRNGIDEYQANDIEGLPSNEVKGSALEITCLLTQQLAQRNFTLVTSLHQFGYVITAYKARKLNASLILVLDRGIVPVVAEIQRSGSLFPHFSFLLGKEKKSVTKRKEKGVLGGEAPYFDPSRYLLVSPFKPLEKGAKGNGAWRDRCVINLAQLSIAVHIRRGGNMEAALLEAHQRGKSIWVCRCPALEDEYGGNQTLIEAGCTPLTPDISALHLNALLVDAKKTTSLHESELARRQRLGQFFTPTNVADFMWDLLLHFAGGSLPDNVPRNGNSLRGTCAIDPTVGQGVFLWTAIKAQRLPVERLYGVDIDETLLTDWQVNFKNHPQVNLFLANGLIDNPWIGLQVNSFDVVIGNPPYGGEGLRALSALLLADKEASHIREQLSFLSDESEESPQPPALPSEEELAELRQLAKFLVQYYESWRLRNDTENFDMLPETSDDDDSPRLFRDALSGSTAQRAVKAVNELDARNFPPFFKGGQGGFRFEDARLTAEEKDAIRRLATFPIELLFVERFMQLCKPGGLIGIIVPDGVLANSQTQPIRNWLLLQGQVKAVVSLPRRVFTGVGANAKTSVLVMRKYTLEERAEVVNTGRMPMSMETALVWMASIDGDKFDDKEFNEHLKHVLNTIKEGNPMSHKISNPTASMVTTVSQPKLYDLRWSPDPWNPEFLKYVEQIKNYHNGYTTLGKLLKPNGFAFPDCVRKSKGELFGKDFKTCYYSVSGILETGFDLTAIQQCSDNAYERLSHTQLHKNDILIARSGAGSVGKVSIVNFDPGQSCTGDLFVLRIQGYNPEALFVFLKSNHAQKQFSMQIHGTTGMVKLNTKDIKKTLVPLFPNSLQMEIRKHFKVISKLHFEALEHKRKEDYREFKRIIRIAESKLENLKRRVELTVAKDSDILLEE